MKPHHWIAAFGIGLMFLVPIGCFLAWMLLERDGQSAIGFSLMFIGLGFFLIWVSGNGREEEE